MVKILVFGPISEKILEGIELENIDIENIVDVTERIEKKLEEEEFTSFWLSEGLDDYGALFMDREGKAVFLCLTLEGDLYIADIENVKDDPAVLEFFIHFIRNYFAKY